MALPNSRMYQFYAVTDTVPKVYIDSVELVHEVKKHPLIYNTWMKRDQFARFASWEVVITTLLPNFPMMTEKDKFIIRKNVRARWSWMRSTLRRDLARNKLHSHLHLKWMNEMQFLLPSMMNGNKTDRDTKKLRIKSSNKALTSATASTSNCVTSTTVTSNSLSMVPTRSSSSPKQNALMQFFPHSSSTKNVSEKYDDTNEQIIQTFVTEFGLDVFTTSPDPDKNFLFVILHVFRKLSYNQKEMLRKKLHGFMWN